MAEQSSSLLANLKSHLPESSWSWVIPALKHDRTIWGTLQDPSFLQTVFDSFPDPEEWTPAQLVLLKLFGSYTGSISAKTLQEGEKILDTFLQSDSGVNYEEINVELLANIAIGVNNRYKENIRLGIEEIVSSSRLKSHELHTLAAILFGLSSDQDKLIHSLICPYTSSRFASLAVHALLSNPLPSEELKELLEHTLDDLNLIDCTRFLQLLNQYRPELTKELADSWLDHHPLSIEKESTLVTGDQLLETTSNLLAAEIYNLAGRYVQASEFFLHSLDTLNSIHAKVSNQLVTETLQIKNIEQALLLWSQKSSPPENIPPANLVINLLQAGRLDDSKALLQEIKENNRSPLLWLISLHQALNKEDFCQARLFANQILDFLADTLESKAMAIESLFGSSNDTATFLTHFIKLLFDLSMHREAIQAAQIAIQINPYDPQLFIYLSQAGRLIGEFDLSIEAAQFAVALDPLNPVIRRQLSASLEASGQWQAALPERQAILGHRFAQPDVPAWPTSRDFIALANCSLHAGLPDQAVDICKKALELEPTNGNAHAILGEALSAKGDDELALEHLSLATQLTPHDASPWLSLSIAQNRAEEKEKAIETLRTASHAVPDDPSIFLALGKAFAEDDALTQAQAALSRAYDLIYRPTTIGQKDTINDRIGNAPETYARTREQQCEIAMAYGNILEQLGHIDQAVQIYKSAYDVYPSYKDLAYTYATALINVGKEKEASAPLAVTVASNPDQPQPYINYARIMLSSEEQPEEAVQALKKALMLIDAQQEVVSSEEDDINSDRDMTLALLAQAQEACGDLPSSIRTYSQALESNLASNPQWNKTLTLGMARVALALGQPEMAIAALQDASRGEIQDTSTARILCEAYAAINLTHEAAFAARTAVHLAPDDVDLLAWFADRAIELGIMSEAIPALTRAAELNPQRTDLIIKLGNLLSRLGKTESAQKAYVSTLSSPYALPEHLHEAAEGLSDIGDNESAVDCLERALELQPNPPASLINELVDKYQSADKAELALRTVDRGIELEPENISLHTTKANLLVRLGRFQAAQACLEHALILNPDDPQINLSIAHVLRLQGEIISAFDHAYEAIQKLDPYSKKETTLAAKGLAAELARATIQEAYLNELLADMPHEESESLEKASKDLDPSLLNYYCLFSESALDREEQIAAASALNIAYTIDPDHPRVLALQSRLAIRQGDHSSAEEAFENALNKVQGIDLDDETQYADPNSFLGVALAGSELYYWELAIDLLDTAISSSPKESYLYLQKARLLVTRAEFERLCQLLDIKKHSPGPISLSPRTFRLHEETINEAVNTLSDDLRIENPQLIQRWNRRGLIAFQPNLETIQTLENLLQEPDDQAAIILALHQIADKNAIAKLYESIKSKSEPTPIWHRIQALYALSMSLLGDDQFDITQAQDAILAAISQAPTEPIYRVIHAKIAQNTNDVPTASHAIQTALSIWPDEPRWYVFAAHLAMQNGNPAEACDHLENAIACEPEFPYHYLELGEIHTILGNAERAIEVLKQAVQIAPDQLDTNIALSTAQLANRDYSEAIKNSEVAISLAPDRISPLLLRAEIALKMNNPNQAKAHVEAALRLKADDPEALHMQARTLQQLGNIDEALSIIDKAIPFASDPLPLLLQRIQLRKEREAPESILDDLQALSSQFPEEPILLAPLAESLAEAGQLDASIQAAQQALRYSNSHLTKDEQAKTRHLLGVCLRQSGQMDQAIHQFSEAIRIAPDCLETYLELGQAQEERRQHAQALATYKKAISIDPSDPRPYYHAGLLLKSSRDYPAAESMLRRAAENSPEDIGIHRQLAALVALNLVHNLKPVPSNINQA